MKGEGKEDEEGKQIPRSRGRLTMDGEMTWVQPTFQACGICREYHQVVSQKPHSIQQLTRNFKHSGRLSWIAA